ncbi:uncharacterized protein IWZ02DRAFT_8876 [Phyllosticta citriasiana]|uniref:uncharacterized protein n=1 Tax=Phyllosticta citriasiana TaxID=595635 RepID=UPI0030FD6E7D
MTQEEREPARVALHSSLNCICGCRPSVVRLTVVHPLSQPANEPNNSVCLSVCLSVVHHEHQRRPRAASKQARKRIIRSLSIILGGWLALSRVRTVLIGNASCCGKRIPPLSAVRPGWPAAAGLARCPPSLHPPQPPPTFSFCLSRCLSSRRSVVRSRVSLLFGHPDRTSSIHSLYCVCCTGIAPSVRAPRRAAVVRVRVHVHPSVVGGRDYGKSGHSTYLPSSSCARE